MDGSGVGALSGAGEDADEDADRAVGLPKVVISLYSSGYLYSTAYEITPPTEPTIWQAIASLTQ